MKEIRMPKGTKVNWKDLTNKAAEIVKTEQNAAYDFLRQKLGGIGVATAGKLLKRLEAKGLVRRGKGRRWVVLVNADGSAKVGAEVPSKRRFRKVRRNKGDTAHAAHVTKANGAISDQMKIEFVQHLADVAEGDKARILKEVLVDLTRFAKERKLLDALK
jgi:ribosomal protein S25